MPARNTTITCPAGAWALLTDGDVAAVTLQNQGTGVVYIAAVPSGDPAPNDYLGALALAPGAAVEALNLEAAFLGVSAPANIWAFCPAWSSDVMVSHA